MFYSILRCDWCTSLHTLLHHKYQFLSLYRHSPFHSLFPSLTLFSSPLTEQYYDIPVLFFLFFLLFLSFYYSSLPLLPFPSISTFFPLLSILVFPLMFNYHILHFFFPLLFLSSLLFTLLFVSYLILSNNHILFTPSLSFLLLLLPIFYFLFFCLFLPFFF